MPDEELQSLTRPATGEPDGLLVLFHGRGADERDLFPLLDHLDPERHLLGVTPRGPLHLPPGGAHWYAVREIGFPDPVTFDETFTRGARGSTRSPNRAASLRSARFSEASPRAP